MPKKLEDWLVYGYDEETWKSLSKHKRSYIRHREQHKAATRKWAERNKEYSSTRQRKYQLRDKYGITEDEYDAMLIAQNNKCAICQKEEKTGRWKRFGVDHCHNTGKVRALLCNECNRGIGLLKDNADLLRAAANYLDSHKYNQGI